MNFYCDIKVLPDPEAPATVLINNLMSKLHRALVQLNGHSIGVSFPNVNKTLGDTLRLHGCEAALQALLEINWLKGLRDYCELKAISPVPDRCQHRVVKRRQQKSAHNKRKRSVAKGWLSPEEAQRNIPDKEKPLKLPFVQLNSASTGQQIKIFIENGPVSDTPSKGKFSCYGLSQTATIPWF